MTNMHWKHIAAALACTCALLTTPAHAASAYPMTQGLHQWPVNGGRVMLVVGTYQDVTSFHRNYAFYFKTSTDDDWNQVVIAEPGGEPQFTWDSATHGEYTLSDGTVVVRDDGLYFVVASKPMTKAATYADRRDLVATWYKFSKSSDPYDPPYMLKPTFKRDYPRTALTVEDVLARELKLQPRK